RSQTGPDLTVPVSVAAAGAIVATAPTTAPIHPDEYPGEGMPPYGFAYTDFGPGLDLNGMPLPPPTTAAAAVAAAAAAAAPATFIATPYYYNTPFVYAPER